ncbi:MAG TPA: undecaprenyldiphospho-muramoylpentapeptide beta-N-acetylglucosaminyltransferase [Actinomycetota bacterium]|nr:undecaprenyldiphospho-muramoylpentapeptide beta-N-acetylglucosaminyltransferase [Actinomycetota bacterium]
MKAVVAGGGTAGHVNPALALAEALAGDEVTFVGTARGVEARLVPAAGRRLELIDVRGFDRARPHALPLTAYVAARSVVAARRLLRRAGPNVVVGMGGYVSLPVCLAARSLRTPVVVHEQNIVLGLANRVSAPLAARIAVSWRETLAQTGGRGVFVGNPVSADIARADLSEQRRRGQRRFGLDPARRTLLVFGGSQGARRVNDAAAGVARAWGDRRDRQLLHVTGPAYDPLPAGADGAGLLVRSVPYVERMIEALAAADLAVCRGGATTIAELTAVGLPSIVVPYPHHRDRQQERHGRALEAAGAAIVIEDERADGEEIGRAADRLLGDETRLDAMRAAARACGHPDAAARLARVVREAAA